MGVNAMRYAFAFFMAALVVFLVSTGGGWDDTDV